MNPRTKNHVQIGQLVETILKKHQASDELTKGIVKRILTKSSQHPHGIKVMLDSGEVGRVQRIIPEDYD